jgi:hypothetical protein
VAGERSTVAPPALSIQAASGELLVSWIDKTGLYGLEAAPSLSGPFTAATNDVQVMSGQNQVTLPISSAGAHFFRLSAPAD